MSKKNRTGKAEAGQRRGEGLKVSQLKLPLAYEPSLVEHKLRNLLRLGAKKALTWHFLHLALDARQKPELYYVADIFVATPYLPAYKSKKNISAVVAELPEPELELPSPQPLSEPVVAAPSLDPAAAGHTPPSAAAYLKTRKLLSSQPRPVVCGTGPAGLFAAYELCRLGLAPLVIERGAALAERCQKVEHFFATGNLDLAANVAFGEGGAGTFSDGKLTSRSKDPYAARVKAILVAQGAPPEIAYQNKPHIGSDVLRSILARLRHKMELAGAEFRFHSCLRELVFTEVAEGRQLSAIRLSSPVGQVEEIPCRRLILAPGHSARDLYRSLHSQGLRLEAKAFALGFRIEHPQSLINWAQWGRAEAGSRLTAADYQLSCQLTDATGRQRGVYSFCMCPGGEVIAAASGAGQLVVNGMSYQARDSGRANSALVCQVDARDYGTDLFAGLHFQERLEAAAFALGGGNFTAPYQRLGDFLAAAAQAGLVEPAELKLQQDAVAADFQPSYRPLVKESNLFELLPAPLSQALAKGSLYLGQKLQGFASQNALLTAVETRTSAPLRLLRTAQSREALDCSGVYPTGEGAGYAGGITSAAIDGLRSAEALFAAEQAEQKPE